MGKKRYELSIRFIGAEEIKQFIFYNEEFDPGSG